MRDILSMFFKKEIDSLQQRLKEEHEFYHKLSVEAHEHHLAGRKYSLRQQQKLIKEYLLRT